MIFHCLALPYVTFRFVNFPHGFLFNTSDGNDARKTSTLRLYTFNRFGGYDFAPLSLGGVRFLLFLLFFFFEPLVKALLRYTFSSLKRPCFCLGVLDGFSVKFKV